MNGNRIVAIHQPNFLPWLGTFVKIARADVFVVLDTVQFPKTGASWTNRVRFLMNGQASWATVPIVRAYHGTRRIDEMLIDDHGPWRSKLLRTIRLNYGKAPYFGVIFPVVEDLLTRVETNLARFNEAGTRVLAGLLRLDDTKFFRCSELTVSGTATDRLVDIVRAVRGTEYLSGDGADGYQEDDKFAAAGMGVVRQNFAHPIYPQGRGDGFVPGLSIVDALMWIGPEQTRALLIDAAAGSAITR